MVDGKIWIYEQAFNFDWVLPLIYPTTDVSIERIEVTQAIQTANNDVRLVEGKDTLVRVFVDSGEFSTVDVKVTLQYCILFFCTKSVEKIHTAVQNPQREIYQDSANFQLPSDWGHIQELMSRFQSDYLLKLSIFQLTGKSPT